MTLGEKGWISSENSVYFVCLRRETGDQSKSFARLVLNRIPARYGVHSISHKSKFTRVYLEKGGRILKKVLVGIVWNKVENVIHNMSTERLFVARELTIELLT